MLDVFLPSGITVGRECLKQLPHILCAGFQLFTVGGQVQYELFHHGQNISSIYQGLYKLQVKCPAFQNSLQKHAILKNTLKACVNNRTFCNVNISSE